MLLEAVADAPYGLDRVAAEGPVDLLAQIADVDVDDVRAALIRHVPGSFEELCASECGAGATHEELQQRELLRREIELRLAAPGAVCGGVEAQVPDLDGDRALRRHAPGERA